MSLVTAIVLGAMSVSVFAVTRTALEASRIFWPAAQDVGAFCMAALSALGLMQMFSGSPPAETARTAKPEEEALQGMLLPYAVLAIAVAAVLIFIGTWKLAGWLGGRHDREEQPEGDWIDNPDEASGCSEGHVLDSSCRQSEGRCNERQVQYAAQSMDCGIPTEAYGERTQEAVA